MPNIEIVFNRTSFSEIYAEESLKLVSSFKLNDPIQIFSHVQNMQFNNRNELIALFERIRGADINSLQKIFFTNNYIKWTNANIYEQQAFKSLVLIYHWLELSISNPSDLDVRKNLYNEFIVLFHDFSIRNQYT